jgi:hypothetical protein
MFNLISKLMKSNKITQDDFLAYSSLAMIAGFIIVLGFGFGLTASIPWMLFSGAVYVLIAIAGNAFIVNQIEKSGDFYDEVEHNDTTTRLNDAASATVRSNGLADYLEEIKR